MFDFGLGLSVGMVIFGIIIGSLSGFFWMRRVEKCVEFIEAEKKNLEDVLDWFEADEEPETPPESPVQKLAKVITHDFLKGKIDVEEKTENEDEILSELERLEREKANIENAAILNADDPLDHYRNITEAIADLKDKNLPPAA